MRPTRDEMQRMEGESEHTGDALQVKNWERVVQKGVAVAVKRQWCECAMPTLDLLERRPTHARVVPVPFPPFFARSPTQLYSPSPSSSYPNSSLAQRHLTSEAGADVDEKYAGRGGGSRDTLRGGKHGSAVAKHGGYGSAGVWGAMQVRARMRVRLQGASWECDRQQWIMQTKGMPTRWAQVERDGTASYDLLSTIAAKREMRGVHIWGERQYERDTRTVLTLNLLRRRERPRPRSFSDSAPAVFPRPTRPEPDLVLIQSWCETRKHVERNSLL
ncbi:hypothetical protein B0H12DRAFT_1229057 [Mycena haematopus]|nr:hypothetical protein B0H12DRAFT_1229057 [Mycena haematopus]